MTEVQDPHLLSELMEGDQDGPDGTIVCPGCGFRVCSIGFTGDLTGFETACPDCGATLVPDSAVFVPQRYVSEHGLPDPDWMETMVTEAWDAELAEGPTVEVVAGYKTEGDIESGEYAGMPYVEPVMEEKDATEMFASIREVWAEEMGWDWEPEGSIYD